jgi:hypothetical protein
MPSRKRPRRPSPQSIARAALNQAATQQADDVRRCDADNDEHGLKVDIVVGHQGKHAPDRRQHKNVAEVRRIRRVAKRHEPVRRCLLAFDLDPDEPVNNQSARCANQNYAFPVSAIDETESIVGQGQDKHKYYDSSNECGDCKSRTIFLNENSNGSAENKLKSERVRHHRHDRLTYFS